MHACMRVYVHACVCMRACVFVSVCTCTRVCVVLQKWVQFYQLGLGTEGFTQKGQRSVLKCTYISYYVTSETIDPYVRMVTIKDLW